MKGEQVSLWADTGFYPSGLASPPIPFCSDGCFSGRVSDNFLEGGRAVESESFKPSSITMIVLGFMRDMAQLPPCFSICVVRLRFKAIILPGLLSEPPPRCR